MLALSGIQVLYIHSEELAPLLHQRLMGGVKDRLVLLADYSGLGPEPGDAKSCFKWLNRRTNLGELANN